MLMLKSYCKPHDTQSMPRIKLHVAWVMHIRMKLMCQKSWDIEFIWLTKCTLKAETFSPSTEQRSRVIYRPLRAPFIEGTEPENEVEIRSSELQTRMSNQMHNKQKSGIMSTTRSSNQKSHSRRQVQCTHMCFIVTKTPIKNIYKKAYSSFLRLQPFDVLLKPHPQCKGMDG